MLVALRGRSAGIAHRSGAGAAWAAMRSTFACALGWSGERRSGAGDHAASTAALLRPAVSGSGGRSAGLFPGPGQESARRWRLGGRAAGRARLGGARVDLGQPVRVRHVRSAGGQAGRRPGGHVRGGGAPSPRDPPPRRGVGMAVRQPPPLGLVMSLLHWGKGPTDRTASRRC